MWPGQLAALAGLGALGHLDLEVVGVDQVLAGDAEAARRHLLDGAALESPFGIGHEALGVLAALARVGLAAEAVHGDGQGLVRLGRDRAVAHRAGGEALDDLADRLDLVDRDRRARPVAEPEQAAQRASCCRLVVDERGVLLEDVVPPGAGGVLELEDRLGVEEVVLALAAPLVLAAGLEVAVGPLLGPARVGDGVAQADLLGELVEADAAEAADGAGEVLVDELLAEADGLEDLRAGVGRDRRDAHLGHHLQDALAGGLDVVVDGLHRVAHVGEVLGDEVLDRLEGEVRVDGARRRSPSSRQKWCTSRASPVSTMRPTWVRVFSRIRWWCTAAVNSSDGIGASVLGRSGGRRGRGC